MSAPTLNLEPHENGAEARLDFTDMPMAQRLRLLRAACSAMHTGHFLLTTPHVRTLCHGHRINIARRDGHNITSQFAVDTSAAIVDQAASATAP